MANLASSAPPQETIFEVALRDFRNSLTSQQILEFQSTQFHDLKTFLAAVQAKQKSERTLQNMTRLNGFLEAMEAYGKVIDVFVNVNNVVAFVWVSRHY